MLITPPRRDPCQLLRDQTVRTAPLRANPAA